MNKNTLLVFLSVLLLATACQSRRNTGAQQKPLQQSLDAFVHYRPFQTAHLGAYALDLNTGKVLLDWHSDKLFRPASTQKLLSTAAALEVLKPDYRFASYLGITGTLIDSLHYLQGDVIIRGGGDPALGSRYFKQQGSLRFLEHFSQVLHQAGIDSIAGRVLGDSRYYGTDMMPPARSWQNMGNYYGAGPCGLTVCDNTLSLHFKTGAPGSPALLSYFRPALPGLLFDIAVLADSIRYDNAYVFGAPYCNYRYVRGSLPALRNDFVVKASLPDPALTAAFLLDSTLKASGIKTSAPPSTFRLLQQQGLSLDVPVRMLDTLYSPPLHAIVELTNTHSINLFAEHCLMQTGISLGAPPHIEACADSLKAYWHRRGMEVKGLSMHDGSGLSQYNRLTPRQMVFLLAEMKNHSHHFKAFYQSLPVAGKSGTLKNMFKGTTAYAKVHAKSGTIDGVKAYAGYVEAASGHLLAFYLVVNDFSCSSRQAREQLEKIMIALADSR